MKYVARTKNLTKQYGKVTVVDNINIHVPCGKIYGLLGRNGAGKTTLMKMMLQLAHPTRGEIQLFGNDIRENNKSLYSKIGSIIETPGFYNNLSAYENLKLLCRIRGENDTSCILRSLKIVGLDNELRKPFSDYSLGMKQRLGIAAAIMHEPELLILDEPINGLDPIGISEIRFLLSELSKAQGITILISSHVLNEIEQIADVIGVMHEGRLIKEVDMTELHKHRYIEFELSDTKMASGVLENKFGITNYFIDGNKIKVYDFAYECGKINRVFVEQGLIVIGINIAEENLEDYFSDLIGGGGIA